MLYFPIQNFQAISPVCDCFGSSPAKQNADHCSTGWCHLSYEEIDTDQPVLYLFWMLSPKDSFLKKDNSVL